MNSNVFARVLSITELEDSFEMRISPENISHDGERSQAQIKAAYRSLMHDYKARRKELTAQK